MGSKSCWVERILEAIYSDNMIPWMGWENLNLKSYAIGQLLDNKTSYC